MRDDLRLCAIPSKNVKYMWELVDTMILAGLKYANGKYTLQDIYHAILDRDMQLWLIVDIDDIIHAAIVTQIIYYPSKKVMLFVIVSGVKFNNWIHELPHFVLFARSHDCESIEFYGRSGWEKKVKKLGFDKIHTVFSLNINGD